MSDQNKAHNEVSLFKRQTVGGNYPLTPATLCRFLVQGEGVLGNAPKDLIDF